MIYQVDFCVHSYLLHLFTNFLAPFENDSIMISSLMDGCTFSVSAFQECGQGDQHVQEKVNRGVRLGTVHVVHAVFLTHSLKAPTRNTQVFFFFFNGLIK